MKMERVPFICYESFKKFPLIFIIYPYRLLCYALLCIYQYTSYITIFKCSYSNKKSFFIHFSFDILCYVCTLEIIMIIEEKKNVEKHAKRETYNV